MDDVDHELHRHYRGLLNDQLVKAASAALDARWLARRLNTRAEELLRAASTATRPARARKLRAAGNKLAGCVEQLEEITDRQQAASATAEAALASGWQTTTSDTGGGATA